MTAADETLAGRYRLVERLGRGGTAEVWTAEDEVLRRRVAVKIFHTTGDAADARRAVGEMHTLAALSHPNLVTVFDAGVDDERTFLVLELVAGATLADRLRTGPLDRTLAATVGAQVAAGLAYIHHRGIVHRDVKPANVLLPRPDLDGPAAKLADFGIAQHVGQERLTQVGMTIGTAWYLSPEQITGRPIGPASDVWSLGLVLLETLGHAPAWTGTPVEIAMARLNNPPAVPSGLGPAWVPLLTAMTATDPEARPGATEVRDRLGSLAAGATRPHPVAGDPSATTVLPHGAGAASTTVLPRGGGPGSTTALPAGAHATSLLGDVPVEPEERRRRRRGGLWAGLAAGAAAVAVVVALAWPSGSADPAPAGGASTPGSGATSGAAVTDSPTSAAPTTAAPATSATPETSAAETSAPATSAAPTSDPATSAPAGPGGGGPGGGPGGGGPGGGDKPGKSKPPKGP